MQDEITKHAKKIYNSAKNPNHSLPEKIKDIIVEILIIVFAVSISIWLHNRSEQSHNLDDGIGFLTDLKGDLSKDSLSIDEAKKNITYNINLIQTNDNIGKAITIMPMLNSVNFEGFKSSGKIGYIENKDLRIAILSYYGRTYQSLQVRNNFHNQQLQTLLLESKTGNLKNDLSDPRLKAIYDMYVKETTRTLNIYNASIKQIEEIISMIDKEVTQ